MNSATQLAFLIRQLAGRQTNTVLRLHTVLNENDEHGRLLMAHLQKHEIETNNCRASSSKSATGHCVCIVVRITGLGETPWSFFSVLINGLGRMAKGWNYEGEQVLRQEASLDYTIIRPGIMKEDYDPTESKTHLELADNGEKLPVSPVSYRQIAMLCIDALEQPQTKRTTLTAMNVQNAGNEDDKLTIKQRLERVKSDSRDFPKSLVDEHKRAVKTVFRSLFAIVGLTLGILFRLVLA